MILSLSDVLIRLFSTAKTLRIGPISESMFPLSDMSTFQEDSWRKTSLRDMVKQVKESLKEQDQILIKGSNSMNLAKLVEELENGGTTY